MLVALQRYVVALLLSHQVLSESHAPRQQQLNIAAQLGTTRCGAGRGAGRLVVFCTIETREPTICLGAGRPRDI